MKEEGSDKLAAAGGEKILGHYRILKKIGAGGMGVVYLAEDVRLNRKIALKTLSESFAADLDRLRRFEQEARAASALNHPNILTVYEFGEADDAGAGGVHFLATEFVEGSTLREKIDNARKSGGAGGLPLLEALDVAGQTALALAAAHGAGLVHRDVKPENVMIRPDGIVKVLDFGIAKLAAPPVEDLDTEGETLAKAITQTRSGRISGTLNYMSPEQLRGLAVDARSDVFSLGACLYEMISGRRAFDKPTTSDVIAAILTETPAPVGDYRDDAPAEVQRIIDKALKKDKTERYQSARAFLHDVKNLKREIEFPAPAPAAPTAHPDDDGGDAVETPGVTPPHTSFTETRVTSPAGAPGGPPVRSLLPVAGLLIFLLAVLVAGVWFWLAGKNNSPAETNQPAAFAAAEIVNWRSSPGESYNSGSFSPDGRVLAFASTRGGAKNIWIKQLSGGDPVQVTKDEFRNENPVWSPAGDEIIFYSIRSGASGIWRISSFGGNPAFVKTVKDGTRILHRWTEKGVVYYETERNLFALDLRTGASSQLTNLDTRRVTPNTISVSPDERQVAYVTFENERYGIWTMPLESGGVVPKQVLSLPVEVRNAFWHPDGRRIIYSAAAADGIFQIFAADAAAAGAATADGGGKQIQITSGEKNAFALDVSRDGSKILYGSTQEESDVWGAAVDKPNEFPVASDISSELWAAASPDGKTIAYQSVKNLSQGDKIFYGSILTRRASENPEAPPFKLTASGFLPAWSPDGGQIAFIRLAAGGASNLWTVKASGGEERQLTDDGVLSVEYSVLPYNRTQASYFSWSPDGRQLAYVSKSGGRRNVWLAETDGAAKTQLTDNADANLHIYCPLWSADGAFIAYSGTLSSADGKFFHTASVVDTRTKDTKTGPRSETFQRLLGWAESGKELIVASLKAKSAVASPTEVFVNQIDVGTGAQRQLAKLEAAYLYNIYLSPDKKMLAYVSKKDDRDNIWVVRAGGGGAARKITSNTDPKLYFSSLSWSPDGKVVYFGKQTRYSLLSMVSNFK